MYFQLSPSHVFSAFASICIFSFRPSMYFQRLPTHVFSEVAPICISSVCPRMFFQRLPPHVFSAIARSCVSCVSSILMDHGFQVSSACFFSAPLVFRMFAHIVFPAFANLPIHVFPTLARADLHLTKCALIVFIVFSSAYFWGFPVGSLAQNCNTKSISG